MCHHLVCNEVDRLGQFFFFQTSPAQKQLASGTSLQRVGILHINKNGKCDDQTNSKRVWLTSFQLAYAHQLQRGLTMS